MADVSRVASRNRQGKGGQRIYCRQREVLDNKSWRPVSGKRDPDGVLTGLARAWVLGSGAGRSSGEAEPWSSTILLGDHGKNGGHSTGRGCVLFF